MLSVVCCVCGRNVVKRLNFGQNEITFGKQLNNYTCFPNNKKTGQNDYDAPAQAEKGVSTDAVQINQQQGFE